MKPFEAFYSTFEFITTGTNKLFSLGNDKYVDNYLLIPFFLFGKLAKYIVGFPLGAFLGLLAATMIAALNMFTITNKQNSEDQYNDLTDNESIAVPGEERSSLQEKQHEITEKKKFPKDIKQLALLNKKYHLEHKISLLIQLIEEKIALLNPNCEKHEEVLQRCNQLKSKLNYQQSIAEGAQKFSHNEFYTETKVSCPCGHSQGVYLCTRCRMPLHNSVIQKKTPVYIPDEISRKIAKLNCESIKHTLESESLKLTTHLADYEKRSTLNIIKSILNNFVLRLNNFKNESGLISIYADYRGVLNKLQALFLSEDTFRMCDFIPKSDYSQLFVATKWIQQLRRQNLFFKSMPEELIEHITISVVSPDFSHKEARDLFRNYN